MKTNHLNNFARIAVPYYGSLSTPPSGLARVFFMVEVDLEKKAIDGIGLHVWNPRQEPNLSSWLRQHKTDGLICSDKSSAYGVALKNEGIWVQWQQKGEVYEVVERWIQSKVTRTKEVAYESPLESGMPCTLKPIWQVG